MHIEEKNYQDPFYHSNIFNFYFKNLKIGILDIETTGLNPDRNRVILGGLVTKEDDGIRSLQIFSESREEEATLLEAYLNEIKKLDVLVSYNGDHFDLPFLSKRFHFHGLCKEFHKSPLHCFSMHKSLDLYRTVDRYSNIRKSLPNLKQKTLETYLGLWSDRSDEISGADSVEMYYDYLKTKDESLREKILLHNKDDILQLTRLMKILDKLDLHEIMFHTGFPVFLEDKRLLIESISLKKDVLYIIGRHKNIPMEYRCYNSAYAAELSHRNQQLFIKIPCRAALDCLYIDLEDFRIDSAQLEKYPGYQSGYLLVKETDALNYLEVNHFLKLLLEEILKEL